MKSSNEIVITRLTPLIVKTLVILLAFNPVAFAAAHKRSAASVSEKVRALGIGQGASVWTMDGSHLTGKVATIDATSFTLDRGHKHGIATLAFADVSEVRKSGLTTGDKVSIAVLGVMIGAAVVGVLAVKAESSLKFGGFNQPGLPPAR